MSEHHSTWYGLGIIFGVIVFFFSAAIFEFDAGKVLMYIVLIPLGLAVAVALLMAVWAMVVSLFGRLLGSR